MLLGFFLHVYHNFVAKVCDIWSWNHNHWLCLYMLLRTSLSTLLYSSLLFSFPLLLLCYLSPNFCNEPSVTWEIANFPTPTTKQILLRHVVEAHWAIRHLLYADILCGSQVYSQTHQAASKNPLHQFCNASSTHQLHPRLKGLQKHCSAILKGKQALSVSTTWPRKVRRNINCTSPHHLWNQHGICPVSEANSGMRTALTMFIAACGIMDKT